MPILSPAPTRRALLALPLAAAPLAAVFAAEISGGSAAGPPIRLPSGDGLRIDPGAKPTKFQASVESERLRLDFAGWPAPILLPARRARLVVTLALAGREVLLAAFAGERDDAAATARGALDLVAMIGSDGTRLGILGVEMLAWKGSAGAGFATMLDAPGHGAVLRLARIASPPQATTSSRHLTWSDYLAWRQGGPLADAAPRPPRPGTWQAALAAVRAKVAALLAPIPTTLTLNLLAPTGLLDPAAEIPPRSG